MMLHDLFPGELTGSDLLVGDCAALMKTFPADLDDRTVTSPPYDNLRMYNGYSFDFETVAQQLYRVTKPGGVVVWVVGDQTVDGDETGTSFRQALYFKECGFKLHDTMIYEKAGTGACGSRYAYIQSFEFMFVFAKQGPATIHLLADKRNIRVGAACNRDRSQTGVPKESKHRLVPEFSVRPNIWRYQPGNNGDDTTGHPAVFPEALVADHVRSWGKAGDLVFDPFSGSGTTAKMAKAGNRRFLGCEISREYAEQSKRRVDRQDNPLCFEE